MADVRELIRRVRFRHLQMILELERLGSVKAGAQALHLTQPAVSKTLGEVERAFGFELFVRGPRGLKPTQRGTVVLRGAAVLLAELGHVLADALQDAPQPKEIIRLGALPYTAQGIAPDLLARVLSSQVVVEITEDGVSQLFDQVAGGQLDAALCGYSGAQLAAPGSGQLLAYDKVGEEQFVVIAPADHRLARKRLVHWSDLANESWIVPSPGSFLRQLVEGRFRVEGLPVPEPVVVSNNPTSNAGLVAQGIGLASVPASTVRAIERAGKVRRLNVHPGLEPVAVALVYRKGASDHSAVVKLRDAVLRLGKAKPRSTARQPKA